MSLYDGLSVETAPVPELVPSAFSHDDELPLPSEPVKSKKKGEAAPSELLLVHHDHLPSPPPPLQEDTPSSDQLSSWSSSNMKLMASQMMRQQMAASKVRRGGGGGGARRKPVAPSSNVTSQLTLGTVYKPVTEHHNLTEDDLAGTDLQDEYDPLVPNNYEEIKRAERNKRREEQQRDKERRKALHQNILKGGSGSDSEEERESRHRKRKHTEKETVAVPPPNSFAPPPPPPSEENKGEEETKVVRSALEELSKLKAPRVNPYGKKNFKTSAVASNIMTKYGWQEGQGLGKESQGISTALSVQKTSFKGGKIVNVAAEREQFKEEEKKMVQSLTDIIKNPTRVILLENMVGAGEVDNDLQPEVIEECSKYGEITNCLIYEIPEGASDDEAVRIFVEFAKKDSAIKAVIDLNGRFFGGRTIRAGFYEEERFAAFDLAPQ